MPSAERRAITVVIADDEAHVRTYLETLLHDEGFVVLGSASDANGVVQLANQTTPDVALVDLRMPGSGLEAIRLISSISPATKLIVFSADDGDDQLLDLLRAGIDGFVTKSSDPSVIAQAIRSIVAGGTVLDPGLNRRAIAALTDRLDAEANVDGQLRRVQGRIDDVIQRRSFTIVHQPIVHLATATTHGVEALTRFGGSTRSPVEWFQDAEACGRGAALEVATVAAALSDLDRLRPDLMMTVNVSPATVLAGRLSELLSARPLDRIVLELTEHARVDDLRALNDALAPWRERGVLIAIDDTGSGHASFSHVLAMRPDLVKIDQAIIDGVERSSSHRSLVRAVVAFAADEGMALIAEGVETAPQLDLVQELGVSYVQGFHLGRPRPLDEQTDLLRAQPSVVELDETVISLREEALLRRGR